MPLYEYSCLDCGVEFESLVLKASEIADVKCPECDSKKLEPKISNFASVSRDGASGAANCAPSAG